MFKIKFVPYENFKTDSFRGFVKDMQENTIIVVDAKLSAAEEAYIIEETMKKVSEHFSGIELSSLDLTNQEALSNFEKIKNRFIEMIIGKKRGLTIVGPAKIIHRIKKNPEELLVYM